LSQTVSISESGTTLVGDLKVGGLDGFEVSVDSGPAWAVTMAAFIGFLRLSWSSRTVPVDRRLTRS
jgi:hypothetical protein